MLLRDRVRTTVALPSIPSGAAGTVEEVGGLFIAVRFDDGRIGFYARRQLRRLRPGSDASASTDGATDLGFGGETVPTGSHLYLAAATEGEARAIAADYLMAGLRAGETCMCCVDRRWRKAVGSALAEKGFRSEDRSSAVIFMDPADTYLGPLEFTADKQLARIERAISGFSGAKVRMFGRLGGEALRSIPEGEWWDYEMRVTHLLRDHGATTVCAYSASDRSHSCHAQAIHPYVIRKGRLIAQGVAG